MSFSLLLFVIIGVGKYWEGGWVGGGVTINAHHALFYNCIKENEI